MICHNAVFPYRTFNNFFFFLILSNLHCNVINIDFNINIAVNICYNNYTTTIEYICKLTSQNNNKIAPLQNSTLNKKIYIIYTVISSNSLSHTITSNPRTIIYIDDSIKSIIEKHLEQIMKKQKLHYVKRPYKIQAKTITLFFVCLPT